MRAHASHWLVMHTHVSMQWITSLFQRVSAEGKDKVGCSSLSSLNLVTGDLALTFYTSSPQFPSLHVSWESGPYCWPHVYLGRSKNLREQNPWAVALQRRDTVLQTAGVQGCWRQLDIRIARWARQNGWRLALTCWHSSPAGQPRGPDVCFHGLLQTGSAHSKNQLTNRTIVVT